MKPVRNLLLFACLLPAVLPGQDAKTIKSDVSAVTLYTLGALVSESNAITLSKGDNQLVFINIPSSINTSVLLLQFAGNARVVSLSSGSMPVSSYKQDKGYKVVLDSIERVDRERLAVSQLISAYENEKAMIDANRAIGGVNNGVQIAELQKAADFYRARMADINKQMQAAYKEQAEVSNALAELEKRRYKLEADFYKRNAVIYATVHSDAAVNETYTLQYFVNGCGWAPFYDIRIDDVSKPISLVYQAKLFNNTGIDWNSIRLTISTAEPGKTALYPSLEKWILHNSDYFSGSYKFSKRKDQNVQYENEAQYDKKLYNKKNENQKDGPSETTISASELSIDFAIPDKKTIPSDARPYLVEIKTHAISPAYHYVAVPKLDLQAYLTCGITDWEQYELMEGRANVYYGKTFIGESYIAPQYADDTLNISLGRDQKVALKYEKKKDYSRKSFNGNTIIQSFSYEITIKNNNSRDVVVDLLDQVPVSASSDITVDVGDISKADWTKDDGMLKWNVNLKAGESTRYIVSYTIKYPKGKPVQIQRFRALKAPDF